MNKIDLSKRYRLGFDKPLEVSQYINFLNEVLKRIRVRVVGEVSGLQVAASGHLYFSLRDKNDGSVLRSVIWKSTYQMCGVKLKDGLEVILSGYADIYPKQGTFNFKAETIELVGEGALKKAYDELKLKLEREGLFDEERKKPIPLYPSKIGIITSLKSGTVIHDFTSNLNKLGFKLIAIDSRVEGQEAVKDLLEAIKTFKNKEIDLLILMRGGGSLQSLMAFDNEMVVREVADFPVPVVAGIGHHKDITLTALVADASESTPTATANLLNRPWELARYNLSRAERIILKDYDYSIFKSKERLSDLTNNIVNSFNLIFNRYKEIEAFFNESLIKWKNSFLNRKREIKEIAIKILNSFSLDIKEKERRISEISKFIESSNPERQLRLGYAIIKKDNKIVKSIKDAKRGDLVDLQVKDGFFVSEIKNNNKKE